MAGVVKKNRQAYGYDYADLPSILLFVSETLKVEVRQHIDYKTAPQFQFGCVVTQVRQSPDGEWSDWLAPVPILVGDETEGGNQKRKNTLAQRYGSAETYARRYSINTALALASTDDDAQTSGRRRRAIEFMSDEQQKTIEGILQALKVPEGREDACLSDVLRENVRFATLTEWQARRFIDLYNKQFNNTSKENKDEQR